MHSKSDDSKDKSLSQLSSQENSLLILAKPCSNKTSWCATVLDARYAPFKIYGQVDKKAVSFSEMPTLLVLYPPFYWAMWDTSDCWRQCFLTHCIISMVTDFDIFHAGTSFPHELGYKLLLWIMPGERIRDIIFPSYNFLALEVFSAVYFSLKDVWLIHPWLK